MYRSLPVRSHEALARVNDCQSVIQLLIIIVDRQERCRAVCLGEGGIRKAPGGCVLVNKEERKGNSNVV